MNLTLKEDRLEDLLGNTAKAFLIFAGGLVPLYVAGGEGRELLSPAIPAIGYLAAAYNVPLRQSMAPSENRRRSEGQDEHREA